MKVSPKRLASHRWLSRLVMLSALSCTNADTKTEVDAAIKDAELVVRRINAGVDVANVIEGVVMENS